MADLTPGLFDDTVCEWALKPPWGQADNTGSDESLHDGLSQWKRCQYGYHNVWVQIADR